MQGFKNINVYIEGQGIQKTDIGFENGKIATLTQGSVTNELADFSSVNAVVVPGFIDEHIHGAAGCDAMDGTVEALASIAKAVASEGTTTFLATINAE